MPTAAMQIPAISHLRFSAKAMRAGATTAETNKDVMAKSSMIRAAPSTSSKPTKIPIPVNDEPCQSAAGCPAVMRSIIGRNSDISH
jgi:hypothetical protein